SAWTPADRGNHSCQRPSAEPTAFRSTTPLPRRRTVRQTFLQLLLPRASARTRQCALIPRRRCAGRRLTLQGRARHRVADRAPAPTLRRGCAVRRTSCADFLVRREEQRLVRRLEHRGLGDVVEDDEAQHPAPALLVALHAGEEGRPGSRPVAGGKSERLEYPPMTVGCVVG